MSIKTRLRKLEDTNATPVESPPWAIEQDAPDAPVRFYRGQPATWGASGGGEAVELSPEEYRRRYVEPFPGTFPLTWDSQPWTADLFQT
jgi:hypothetical protein